MPTIAFCTCVPHSSLVPYLFGCAVEDFPPLWCVVKSEMMRLIESSNLQVDRIVETCINVAEINRAREFYQSLFSFEAMVCDERFCALRAGPDVLLLFTHGGSNEPLVIRGGVIPPHETGGAGHLAFAIPSDALDTWRTRLRESGIEIESEVQWERGGASLYFRDPDANLLELATPGVWPNY